MSGTMHKVREKNQRLNIVKAIACASVIVLHCPFPGIVGKILYGFARFAVPFFFMVSGYFVYADDAEKVISRLPRKIMHIIRLLVVSEIIYFIWHCVQYWIQDGSLGTLEWITNLFTFSNLTKLIIFQSTMIGDVSWFLVALLLCYLFTYVIAKKNLWNESAKLIPILLLTNVVLGEGLPFYGISVPWYWCSNVWLLGFPFFSFGYWIKIHQKELCNRFNSKYISIILVISIGINLLERIITDASQFFLSNAFMAFALFMLCIKYPSISMKKGLDKVEKIGEKHAVHVYIFHPIIRDVLVMTTGVLGIDNMIIYQWSQPILVFGFCIMIGSLFEHMKMIIRKRTYDM